LNTEESYYFNHLKKAITHTFLKNNSASSLIETWKGEEITAFQEDLFNRVKAKVSEKWFYTYFKNNPSKLPRIDMLNLLSNYVGEQNWNSFKLRHKRKPLIKSRKKLLKFSLILILPLLIIIGFNFTSYNQFYFCFIDEDTGNNITNISFDIKILKSNESPLFFKTDSLGCFNYDAKDDKIKFVVTSPYYKTDTIIRHINSSKAHIINLATDDYALMLDYYTNGKVKDWGKRKLELEKLFSDDAKIYQLFSDNIGVEIYSKEEFIRKLTIPTTSLKQIIILDKDYKDGQIINLKFKIE